MDTSLSIQWPVKSSLKRCAVRKRHTGLKKKNNPMSCNVLHAMLTVIFKDIRYPVHKMDGWRRCINNIKE
jgi:hypothetical protein